MSAASPMDSKQATPKEDVARQRWLADIGRIALRRIYHNDLAYLRQDAHRCYPLLREALEGTRYDPEDVQHGIAIILARELPTRLWRQMRR